MISVRERPPLALSVNIETPSGVFARWGADDPRPEYEPQDLSFATAMSGGFDTASCVLERDTRKSYPDIEELARFTVRGLGGAQIAYEGRIEELPDTGGNQAQLSPQCGGWQNHLKDDASAQEIFLDCALSNWQGAAIQRQLSLMSNGLDETDASTSPDQTTGQPALTTQLTGALSRGAHSEGWYDAKGISIGALYYAWKKGTTVDPADPNWAWDALLCNDDLASSFDASSALKGAGPGTGVRSATAANRTWAQVESYYGAAGLTSGVNYPIFWTYLGVVGNHGCPIQGTLGQTGGLGILASDAIAYTLGKWAPKLAYTTGSNGTIQPSTFAIPQLEFKSPTTAAAMIAQMVQYELLDWAVWEGRTFYLNPRGTSVKTRNWRARVGDVQLQETGPSITRLYNGVVISYSDVTGITRTVGPPGSGAEATDSSLADSDPQNPCNQAGINRWALLQMGTLGTTNRGGVTTAPAAIQLGKMYLQEQKLVNTAGQASIVGHVQDDKGVWWPAWMVRAGDTLSIVDASDPSPRRVVSTSYADSSKTNTVQLDQPPQTVAALLQMISAAVAPYGMQ